MPDYKKRRRSRLYTPPVKSKKLKKNINNDIEMTPYKSKKEATKPKKKTQNLKVLNGKKLENRRKMKIASVAVAFVLIFVLVFNLIFPAGFFETVSNKLSAIGNGGYPISIESSKIVHTASQDSFYYVLTQGYLNVYANNGKKVMEYSHGFENPVLKLSDTRALLFEQGGNKVYIFNVNDLILSFDTENEIITGNISKSGEFTIACRSAQYTAEVLVYNKKGETLYKWYSAEEIVNNVALNSSGKKLAVATFISDIGGYHSKLRILNFKSANPEFTQEFNNTLIYELNTGSRGNLGVVTQNNIKFIKWSNFKEKKYENDYSTSFFSKGKGGYVGVFNRESDKTDNNIAVFSNSGELKYEFKFKGIITDIKLYNGNVYCLNDTDIFILDEKGNTVMQSACGFGATNINVISSNAVAVISNNNIE